jgi:hypothetical protein
MQTTLQLTVKCYIQVAGACEQGNEPWVLQEVGSFLSSCVSTGHLQGVTKLQPNIRTQTQKECNKLYKRLEMYKLKWKQHMKAS